MPKLITVYWRDIPSQVIAKKGGHDKQGTAQSTILECSFKAGDKSMWEGFQEWIGNELN